MGTSGHAKSCARSSHEPASEVVHPADRHRQRFDRLRGRGSRWREREPDGRAIHHRRYRHANRARVADQRRHRRRARHLAERAADQRQDAGHDLDVRLEPRRRDQTLRDQRPARSRAPDVANQGAVPEREDRSPRQRAQHRPLGNGQQQGRHRARRQPCRRLRGQEGRHHHAAAARRGGAVESGAAPRAVRRGVAQRADRARREFLHQPGRPVPQRHRPGHDRAISRADL